MPEVSVVIPSYNHAEYIGEAVESVLAQSLADLELVVVDDGSTDRSLEVLAAYRDPRLRVLSQSNRGAHAAINRGLAEATGEYLAILNSDDAYHPARLEKAIAALEAEPQAGLLGTYIQIVDRRGEPGGVKHGYQDCPPWLLEAPERSFRAGSDLRAALLTENYWSTTSNFVIRRDLYQQVGPFRPLRYTHDWDFALRAARIAPMILLPEALMRYRVHPANTIREDQAAMVFEICWILAVHLPQQLGDPAFFDRAARPERVDQLLHSIYVFGADRVLSVLLLERIDEDPEKAIKLLDPADPVRARYLEYIQRFIDRADDTPGSLLSQEGEPSLRTLLARRLPWLRRMVKG